MSINIAIDGPAGAGKSTIAKKVAQDKGYIYIDTGAMYRAIGYYAVNNSVDMDDDEAVSNMCNNTDITIAYIDGEQNIFLNGENINIYIRTNEASQMASIVAKNPIVREKLVELQKKLAKENNVVMDGRDIGTCVLPNAQIKIYLTASSDVRAKRRQDELLLKGIEIDFNAMKKEIDDRDYSDMHREFSPLMQAEDAILIDTSYMTIDEVVRKIVGM